MDVAPDVDAHHTDPPVLAGESDLRAVGRPGGPTTFADPFLARAVRVHDVEDRKSTRLNSSHMSISYAVFCLKKKKKKKKIKTKKKKKKKKKKIKEKKQKK